VKRGNSQVYRLQKFAIGTLACAIVAAAIFAATTRISRAGGLAGVQWNQIGPAPLSIDAEQNYQGAGPDSGEVTEIAIDPRGTTDQVMYISTNNGGIWKTTDGGNTWFPMTDSLASLSGGAVALDFGNPSIVYFGTGNNFSNGFDNPIGIYKSTNQGGAWTLVPGSPTLAGNNIIRMVSPAANVLVVATTAGLFRSSDGGNSFTNIIPPGATATSYITDLKLDTTASNTVIAAVYGLGIFISSDGGQTFGANLWTTSNNSPLESPNDPTKIGYIAFGQSTAPNDHVIYATVQNTQPSPSRFLGMWRSTDYGATWQNIPAAGGAESSPPTSGPGDQDGNAGSGCQCGYDQTVGVDPLNADRVYIGFQELWLSTNGTTTNTLVTFSSPAITLNQVHWDHHALVFSPATHVSGPPPTTPLYVGQDGGIATSSDGGSTWTNINGPTNTGGVGAIATNLFRGIDIGRNSGANNAFTYGGTQDTGTIEMRPPFLAANWHLGIDGDGGPVAVDPGNPDIAIGNDDGTSIRTTDGGATWTFGIPSLPGSIGAVAFDPIATDKIAYASSFNSPDTTLFQSTDEGATWTAMHLVPNDKGIDAIAGTPADGNTVWLGLNDGTLTFTTNALLGVTATWNNVTIPGAPAGVGVSAVAIDPTTPNIIVVTYPTFTGINPDLLPTKHVFRSTDSGNTWTDISGTAGGGIQNLPDIPVNSVTIDPNTNPHTIIIGTDAGVFQTADDGNSWQVLGLGLPTVQVTSVQLDPNALPELLRIGTYGRSAFELDPPSVPLVQVNSNFSFGTVCGNGPFTEKLQIFNVGEGDLSISSIARISGSNNFTLSPSSAPVTVPEGSEIDYNIVYTPTQPNVTETATFQINSNDPFQPALQVTYTATSGAPAVGTVIAQSGNYGNVCLNSFKDLALTVTNSGTCDLQITNVASSNPLFAPPSVLSFPVVVHAGTSIELPIRYTPTAVTSVPDTANITVTTNDPVNPIIPVAVSGTSTSGKIAASIAPNGDFGNVCRGSFGDLNLTITNNGACPLNATGVSSTNPLFTVASVITYPLVLGPGTSVAVPIRYTPTAITSSPDTGNIDIMSSDVSNPTLAVAVQGSSAPGKIAVTGTANFGDVCAENTKQQTFDVNNVGKCDLNVTSATVNCSDFTITSDPFPNPISPDSNLDLIVKFTPTSVGAKNCMLTINSDDPVTPVFQESLMGDTPSPGISLVTNGLTFPPTVIKNRGVCQSSLGLPIANASNACGVTITNLGISGTNANEYSLAGQPTLPITLGPGQQLGAGDLDAVFSPNSPIARTNTAQVNVTYQTDPILHTTATAPVPMCAESTARGVRALILVNGTPAAHVDKIALLRVNAPSEDISPLTLIDRRFHAPLTTVTGSAPCPSFQYQYEYGTVTTHKSLRTGIYVLTVTTHVGNKIRSRNAQFSIGTCDFDQNLVLSLP
jgi:photosystem II stability/assembly factor-like uncharacterized protein